MSGSLHSFHSYFGTFTRADGAYTQDTFYTSNPGGEAISAYSFVAHPVWYLFMGNTSKGIVGDVGIIWRYWNPTHYNHFYRISNGGNIPGYIREGAIGWAYTGPGQNRVAVYKFYNSSLVDHKFKTSASAPAGYTNNGIAWYSPIPVYGCGDSSASNYNAYVNQPNTGCQYIRLGCTDPLANNFDSNANTDNGSCTYPTPIIILMLSDYDIIAGESVTLQWVVYDSTARSISEIGTVQEFGTTTVSPNQTTVYTLTANYHSYTSNTRSVTLTVFQPPLITFTVDNEIINSGESTTLRWNVAGDVNNVVIEPGIGLTNTASFQNISPTQTTTYTLSASGPGGSDTAQLTVTVLQPPAVTLAGPTSVDYGDDITLSYSQVNATTTFELRILTNDLDNNSNSETIDLGASPSANGTYVYSPTYTDRGPQSIQIQLYAVGDGVLTDTETIIVGVNIDRTPDAINIPESDDKIKDEDPVITPDATVTSTELVVEDIDIPVRIKSDNPINVQIDNDGIWRDVEQM